MKFTLREIADIVLTAINAENRIVGLLTLRVIQEEGQIGLLGVDESFRRVGIAKKLMNALHRWIVQQVLKGVCVATQIDNS